MSIKSTNAQTRTGAACFPRHHPTLQHRATYCGPSHRPKTSHASAPSGHKTHMHPSTTGVGGGMSV
eukprot:2536713-Pyramimonas_sp.AAC.1